MGPGYFSPFIMIINIIIVVVTISKLKCTSKIYVSDFIKKKKKKEIILCFPPEKQTKTMHKEKISASENGIDGTRTHTFHILHK